MSDLNISCRVCKNRIAKVRGQCVACRFQTAKAIKDGKTTEAAEVAAGRLLPMLSGKRRWVRGEAD